MKTHHLLREPFTATALNDMGIDFTPSELAAAEELLSEMPGLETGVTLLQVAIISRSVNSLRDPSTVIEDVSAEDIDARIAELLAQGKIKPIEKGTGLHRDAEYRLMGMGAVVDGLIHDPDYFSATDVNLGEQP